MAFLYILLIIIAIGVLLLSPEGKSILGAFTLLLVIAGLLYLGFWIVILVFGFALTDTGKEWLGGLGFFLVIGILGAVINKVSEKYQPQIKNNFVTRNKKIIVIGFWTLWPLSLVMTFFVGNYINNETMLLFLLTLSIAVFPIGGLLLLGFFNLAKSNTKKEGVGTELGDEI